jgi:uracil phosphoribosyltransferase
MLLAANAGGQMPLFSRAPAGGCHDLQVTQHVHTMIGDTQCETLATHVQVIPILRAGLVLLEQSATLLPASETYHLGYVRDDETLKVSSSSSSIGRV